MCLIIHRLQGWKARCHTTQRGMVKFPQAPIVWWDISLKVTNTHMEQLWDKAGSWRHFSARNQSPHASNRIQVVHSQAISTCCHSRQPLLCCKSFKKKLYDCRKAQSALFFPFSKCKRRTWSTHLKLMRLFSSLDYSSSTVPSTLHQYRCVLLSLNPTIRAVYCSKHGSCTYCC